VKYKPTPFDSDGVETRFQKCFVDELGKKYFIDIVKWQPMELNNGNRYGATYEYETQFYKKGTHDAVNIEFICSWSIEDVEDYLEKLFETGLFEHYELWDGTRG